APAHQLLAGVVGAGALAVVSALIALPAVVLVPAPWGWPVFGLLVWIGVYEGFQIGAAKSADLLELAGLRPHSATARAGDAVLVDTSAVIDGRLLDVTEAGFLHGTLLVPRFVLDELQGIADAADDARRRRGRRGLETLDVLRRDPRVVITVVDDEVPEFDAVDAKLVALARRLPADIVTTDANLQSVAEMQGVRCRNLNRLAAGLRPAIVPGEVLNLPISREGKEPGQGVGFLDDGTMVVVGDAAELVGRDVAVRITSNVQTSVGRLLFASVIDG
ncbi:MAG TPA: PIN domain-containing protein, partial [Acidimicrobiales bacterium]|nr:PIN domain-containing protein [Acidimicrobiales bacterium]